MGGDNRLEVGASRRSYELPALLGQTLDDELGVLLPCRLPRDDYSTSIDLRDPVACPLVLLEQKGHQRLHVDLSVPLLEGGEEDPPPVLDVPLDDVELLGTGELVLLQHQL